MAEESSESITLSDGDPVLSKVELLERSVWTLQYNFEELLEEDKEVAADFIRWATKTFIAHLKVDVQEQSACKD